MKDLFGYESFNSDEWFKNEFWPKYPKKVHRAYALKITKKIVKKKEDAEMIMKSLVAHLNTWQDPRFIPDASSFLNKRYWEDEKTNVSSLAQIEWKSLETHFLRFGRYTERQPKVSSKALHIFAQLGGRNIICDSSEKGLRIAQRRFIESYDANVLTMHPSDASMEL